MRENPVRGYEIPRELNPRRPVATTDRYEAIREVSDEVQMEIRWFGKRTKQRWKTNQIVQDLYQQADPSTILKAVLHTDELREAP